MVGSQETFQQAWPGIHFDFRAASVLVTGGTSGIGAAMARAFQAAGAQVTITGTRESLDAYAEAPEGVSYQPLKLQDRESLQALAGRFDQLDVLINNAGGTGGAEQPFDFDTAVQVNLNAVYHLSEALSGALARSRWPGGASIINLASEMALFGSPYFPGYGAAKAAVVQLTRTQAVTLAEHAIRANALLPGSVPTPMTAAFAENQDIHEMVADKTPLGRWGRPEEIAGPALFLASPLASFISGHTLVVDGGYSIFE